MQALKLIIRGSYYDSQIYSGQLYLFNNDGSITTLDWNQLIDSITIESRLKLALDCAFRRSDFLYKPDFEALFHDEEIKNVIIKKFEDLSHSQIEFTQNDLRKNNIVVAEQQNPFSFPHADSQFYFNTLYVGSPTGVLASSLLDEGDRRKRLNSKSTKLWDGPTLNMSTAHSTLALAAGSEGLFELPLRTYGSSRVNPYQVSEKHSTSVRWMYSSVFSSSYFDDSYLAYSTWEKEEEKTNDSVNDYLIIDEDIAFLNESQEAENHEKEKKVRKLQEIIPSSTIFKEWTNDKEIGYTWGVQDKICLAVSGAINVIRYSPKRNRMKALKNESFKSLGNVNINQFEGEPIRGDSAVFGFVLELEDGLFVVASDMESSIFLPGEPVNWRVFPKSKLYTNQLHVIYDDYIAIYSFNQDYFVDQEEKKIGVRYNNSPNRNTVTK